MGSKAVCSEDITSNKKSRCTLSSSHLGLCLALIAYTAAGGLVFRHLEYPAEIARLAHLEKWFLMERSRLLETLVNMTLPDKLVALDRYDRVIQEVGRGGLSLPLTAVSPRWSYLQAVFFSSTVLTTIGYGNITPSTMEGRLFCIFFALVGIPLTVSVMADIGALIASTLPAIPEARGLKRSLASAVVASSILFLYIAAGSLLFICWEDDWTFFDSFYFCFVTMTTIGFGDLVPSTPQYMLLCNVYILVGLSLTSTIIEVVRQQYSQSWKHLQSLAESLAHLASDRPDLTDLVAAMKTKQWEQAVQRLVEEIKNQKERPRVVQIIVYESSV